MPPRKEFRRPNDIDVIELSSTVPNNNEPILIKRHLPSGSVAVAGAVTNTFTTSAVSVANAAVFGATLKARSHNNDKESLTTDFMKEKEKKKVR